MRVYEAADFAALRSLAGKHDLDLALVDLNMPGMQGTRADCVPCAASSRRWCWSSRRHRTIATTIRDVLATGARGFFPQVVRIRAAAAGDPTGAGGRRLSARVRARRRAHRRGARRARQRRADATPVRRAATTAARIAEQVIARELSLTEGTVKIHIAAILRALHARNQTEAVVRARTLGLDNGT